MILLFYKCRWCGEVFSQPYYDDKPDTAAEVVLYSYRYGVNQYEVHTCPHKPGYYGMADFIGAREEGEDRC